MFVRGALGRCAWYSVIFGDLLKSERISSVTYKVPELHL